MTSDRRIPKSETTPTDAAAKKPNVKDVKTGRLDTKQLDQVTGGMRKAGGDPQP